MKYKANVIVRNYLRSNHIKCKEVAGDLGITPEHLSRVMRDEMTDEYKKKIVASADEILRKRGLDHEQNKKDREVRGRSEYAQAHGFQKRIRC